MIYPLLTMTPLMNVYSYREPLWQRRDSQNRGQLLHPVGPLLGSMPARKESDRRMPVKGQHGETQLWPLYICVDQFSYPEESWVFPYLFWGNGDHPFQSGEATTNEVFLLKGPLELSLQDQDAENSLMRTPTCRCTCSNSADKDTNLTAQRGRNH